MKYLINRENYINEYLYNKSTENTNELYEGLINTLFGGVKMLLKKDWANIRCKNPSVLEYLKEIDKSLNGYTFAKMKYPLECNNIRQNVADYFNDILEYKLSQIKDIENEDEANEYLENDNKENDELKGVEKILNLKDNTILDNIKKYKENISTSCKHSSKLKEYAEQMLNSVTVFVNDIVIKELEKKGADKAKLDTKRKKLEEENKKLEEVRDKMNELSKKAGEESIKKLSDERDKAMRNLNIKPINAMSGDKSIDMITKQFKDMIKEFDSINESAFPKEYSDILRSDTYIGIQKSFEELNWDFSDNKKNITEEEVYNRFLIKVILNKINTVFKVVSNNKNMFKDVPSASVQSMMVSLSNAIIYGYVGKQQFDIENKNDRLSLMTKCAIDSDATIGFNLPLIDPKKPENGNFFTSIMNQFKNVDISSKEVDDVIKHMGKNEIKKIINWWSKNKGKIKDQSEFIKQFGSIMMKDFRQNMNELFDIIVKKANELKQNAVK